MIWILNDFSNGKNNASAKESLLAAINILSILPAILLPDQSQESCAGPFLVYVYKVTDLLRLNGGSLSISHHLRASSYDETNPYTFCSYLLRDIY